MKSVLIISLSSIQHDARVARQIDFLRGQYDLTVAAYDAEPNGIKFIKLSATRLPPLKKAFVATLLLLRVFKLAYKILHSYPELKTSKNSYHLIITNDIETIAIAHDIKGNAKLLFDAHEYFPRQFEDKIMWRILFQPLNKFLCRTYLLKVDAMTTIGEGIAKEYEKQYNVKPIVITNAAPYHNILPTRIHEDKINLVHHGIAIPSRKLELMIDMMDYLDERFYLNLMLISPQTANKKTKDYLPWLKAQASKHNSKVKFIDPVKSNEIVNVINKFDLGIVLVPPVNFNYQNGLGNKFFDFIQARLALGIGPIPEMAKMVQSYNLGVVSQDFTAQALAEALNKLTKEKLESYKRNAERAARDVNAESNKLILTEIIDRVMK